MQQGRPSKYLPEYCEEIIEFMSTGRSLTAFAAKVCVSKQTVYDWTKAHPAFLDATNIARAKCQSFWEDMGFDHMLQGEGGPKFNHVMWIFNMKARFGMSDVPKDEAPIEDHENEYGDLYAKSESEK